MISANTPLAVTAAPAPAPLTTMGFIQAPKAEGGVEKVGFMTFSAGLVSPSLHSFADIREITELAAEARRQDAAATSTA